MTKWGTPNTPAGCKRIQQQRQQNKYSSTVHHVQMLACRQITSRGEETAGHRPIPSCRSRNAPVRIQEAEPHLAPRTKGYRVCSPCHNMGTVLARLRCSAIVASSMQYWLEEEERRRRATWNRHCLQTRQWYLKVRTSGSFKVVVINIACGEE